MIFKTKENRLVGNNKLMTIEFDGGLKLNDVAINSPGEYEVGGVLVSSPIQDFYSVKIDNTHIIYWEANGAKPDVKDMSLGDVDVLALGLKIDSSKLEDITKSVNDIDPGTIVLVRPDLKDAFIKAEAVPTESMDSYKPEATSEERDRKIILLPCSMPQ